MTAPAAEDPQARSGNGQRVADFGQNLEYQHREWAVQHGWVVIAVLILAALAGLAGDGPLSHASIRSADGTLIAGYERIARAGNTKRPGTQSSGRGQLRVDPTDRAPGAAGQRIQAAAMPYGSCFAGPPGRVCCAWGWLSRRSRSSRISWRSEWIVSSCSSSRVRRNRGRYRQ